MKFKDLLLLLGILVIAFLGAIGVQILSVKEAERIQVSVDGQVFGVYSLH